MEAIDGNWRDANTSLFLLMALVYWWNISGDLRQMFLKNVDEVDRRIASDPASLEQFSQQQAVLNQQLEIRRRQQQIHEGREEIVRLQKRLEGLHRDLGFAMSSGNSHYAADIRGQIARTESELRSRGA